MQTLVDERLVVDLARRVTFLQRQLDDLPRPEAVAAGVVGTHNLLSATHSDTVVNGATRGSLIYGNSAPAWDELVLGGITGSVLTRNATDTLWSDYALAGTAGQTYTFPAASAAIPGGSGIAGRVTEWATASTLTASTLIKSGAGVLTLTAASAYQLDANAAGGVLVRAAGTPLTAGRVGVPTDGNTLSGYAEFFYQSGASPNLLIQAANAAHIPTVVKAAAAQTANLQEWQNSAGNVIVATRDAAKADATSGVVHIENTLPAPYTAHGVAGMTINVTTAGSASFDSGGLYLLLKPGYTGGNRTIALAFQGYVAGVGNTPYFADAGTPVGNLGVSGLIYGITTGLNIGQYGEARNGNTSVGLYGKAQTAKASAYNIGVVGTARNTGAGGYQIGGMFGTFDANPTLQSAALLCDNGGQTTPIFIARDNGVAAVSILNGGNLLIGTTTDDAVRLNTVHTTTTANAVLEVARFEAQVSTAATGGSAGFGTALTLYAESATDGNYRQQAQLATEWNVATDATRNALMRGNTYPSGSAVGYFGFWSGTAIDGTAQTVIRDATGDVTEAITVQYTVAEITGTDTGGGVVTLEPGDTATLCSDATNILTLTCAADGSVTIARSAGTDTYKVALWMVWI